MERLTLVCSKAQRQLVIAVRFTRSHAVLADVLRSVNPFIAGIKWETPSRGGLAALPGGLAALPDPPCFLGNFRNPLPEMAPKWGISAELPIFQGSSPQK